jgi:hypothetical protein
MDQQSSLQPPKQITGYLVYVIKKPQKKLHKRLQKLKPLNRRLNKIMVAEIKDRQDNRAQADNRCELNG